MGYRNVTAYSSVRNSGPLRLVQNENVAKNRRNRLSWVA